MKKALILLFFLAEVLGANTLKSAPNDSPSEKIIKKESHSKIEQRNFDHFLDQYFDDDFFEGGISPFEQMERMRKQMNDLFKNFNNFRSDPFFDDWYHRKFGGTTGEIKQFEDQNFIYYEISLKDLKKGDIEVKVENGKIYITGSKIFEEENKKEGSYFRSKRVQKFNRIIPTPYGADENKVEIEQKEGKIILKFPKQNKL